MFRASLRIAALLIGLLAALPTRAADRYVWIESEKPTRANLQGQTGDWGKPQFLSDASWLQISLTPAEATQKLPKDGGLLEYDFNVEQGGRYEVWNRIGLEFVRTAFDWRIDNTAWQTITPDLLTTDLMEIGFWCEVAWLKLGQAEVGSGKHTLQIRIVQGQKEEKKQKDAAGKEVEVAVKVPDKVLYTSDCICLVQGAFRPHSKFKPDQQWQTDDDKQAATTVVKLPANAGPAEERLETSLAGLWQVCRYDEQEVVDRTEPVKSLPDAAQAFWMSIRVPGDKYVVKPELTFCHRFVYRTRIRVPNELAGRSFFVRLPSCNMLTSVFVNGQLCGGTKAMRTLFECDVTRAIRPGQINELAVAIKDTYYALSPKKTGKSCRLSFNTPLSFLAQNWLSQHFDFPVSSVTSAGILEEPSFVVAGSVYTNDVFPIASVKDRNLALELTLKNPSGADRQVRVENVVVPHPTTPAGPAGAVAKSFAARDVRVPAGQETVVKLSERWENPQLWWPDKPHLYDVVTRVSLDGKIVDVRRTPFGFRQWEWTGPQFKLNGVPWQLWADVTDSDGRPGAAATVARWRRQGHNMWRFWGDRFGDLNQQAALDFMDAQGIPVRRSGIFDGQGANYLHGLVSTETVNGKQVTVAFQDLFDNWLTQLKAWVKAERNHPSIFVWSIENEITFINSRNLGLAPYVEPQIARAAKEVMALDPTRPAMVDGGNCLMDKSLPINGCHYVETFWRDYPDEAYTLERALLAHEKALSPGWGKSIWQLMPDRPIFMGESYFVRGMNPADFAQFGGESAFTGWAYTKRGAGLYAKMLAEGYRWHGVAAQHFWFGAEDADLHQNSWQPVCVFCRQWNWTFAGGTPVTRTLKVFNDTHYSDPIEMGWELKLDGQRVAGEKQLYHLAPGAHQEVEIIVQVPAVPRRTAGEFSLTCRRAGQEVFREVKPVAVIDPNAGPKPSLAREELAVLDPAGVVQARLQARGIGFTAVAGCEQVTPRTRVLVIGPDALSPRDATDPKWLSLAARGVRVLVLDQQYPLQYQALPADLVPTAYVGRIAFAENLQHPVFAGLDQADFFTWSKDHIVYRHVYQKASHGAKSLAHCDEKLACSAIAECGVNDGLLLLCQLVAGTKLGFDPVAQRLFDNLLAYCQAYQPASKPTAVVFDENTPIGKLLAGSGLIYDKSPDVLSAVRDGQHQVVVVDANPTNLQALVGNADAVKAFTGRGGWLFLWGLTPDGLASFNKLVGVEHLLRPFERERVTLPPVRDPLLSGLTMRDVVMSSGETIMFGDKFLANDVFTHVVDFDDIAPFGEFPSFKHFYTDRDQPNPDNHPRNMVNGFTAEDSWKYIFSMYPSRGRTEFDLKLPREETTLQLDFIPNTLYNIINKIELTYDGDEAHKVTLNLKPEGGLQSVELPHRQVRVLHIKFAGWNERSTQDVIGVDNLWIKVQRKPDFYRQVQPLLNLGALVKYPQGAGGLVLCQLNILKSESVPENADKKKHIVATLLRNLGAPFAGAKLLVAGEGLKYTPLALEEKCNQFLTSDRGWLDGGRDLQLLPVGRNKFAGVEYLIRDFKTSPLASCVMLGGPGVKGNLPNEAKDLPVAQKADALFFLHAFRRLRDWQPPGQGDKTPPALFQYVVRYADGQTVEVPVRYADGADHWIVKDPQGLKHATVAWAAPFPNDKSGEQAVVYQLQWNNPRPDVEIKSVDLRYDPATGGQYGIPALLAITAATRIRP
ncbi:MAG: hypothetical protein NTY19_26375 [Planctomycetota bacterium]|nr:hypothetical protein [Planctomycetota bacterium]